MKNLSILLALAFLILPGCTPQETQEIDSEGPRVETDSSTETETPETDEFGLIVGEEEEAKAAQALKMKEVACEDSGGTFVDETCECPDETYGDNWPLYTYDEETGYCMEAFGIPGGALGEEAKKNNPISE